MKTKFLYKLIYLPCLILCFLGMSANVAAYASSADIVISSDGDEYDLGDYIDIYVDIDADVLPGDFEGCLTFPEDILEYVSGPDIVVEGEGEVIISDSISSQPNRNSRRYSLRFKAVSAGSADLCFDEIPELYEYEEGYLMSVSVNEIRITVRGVTPSPTATPKPTPTPSQVPKGDDKPDTEKSDSGNGGKDLEGNNGNGDDSGRESLDEGKSDSTYSLEKRIRATEDGDGVFVYSENGFKIATETEGLEIPEGYERTSMVIDGVKIPVYTSNDPEAYMLIPIDSGSGTVLYSYDRTEKTLQRYKEKTETVVKHVMTESIEALELANSYEKSLNVMTLIIAVLGGFSMSLLIIVIRMALKHRGDDSSEF